MKLTKFLADCVAFAVTGSACNTIDKSKVYCRRCNWKGEQYETNRSKCPRCKNITWLVS